MKLRTNKTEERPAIDVLKECAVDFDEKTGLPKMYLWLNKGGNRLAQNGKSESIGRLMFTVGNGAIKCLFGVGKSTKSGRPFLYEMVRAQQGQYTNAHPAPKKAPSWVKSNKEDWVKNYQDCVQIEGTLPRAICDFFVENPDAGFETRDTDRSKDIHKGMLLTAGTADATTFGETFAPSEQPEVAEDDGKTDDGDDVL